LLYYLQRMDPSRDIFSYSSYRLFLKDYYLSRKRDVPGFTYKIFGEMTGFSSASFHKLVIDGKKNLSGDSVQKICRGLRLNRTAAAFFNELVSFEQVMSIDEKAKHLKRLDRFRKRNSPERLLPKDYGFLQEWYHCVIRELVDLPDFTEDPAWISGKLSFPVPAEAVKKSLSFLAETGFLVRGSDGRLRKREKTIATGDVRDREMTATIARKHHLSMIGLAQHAIAFMSKEERSVANTTMSLSAKSYEIALKRIERLRMELLDLAAADASADRVYQLNINLFPMTKRN
jgi:uncharacterized protein (TIGR02147 family)